MPPPKMLTIKMADGSERKGSSRLNQVTGGSGSVAAWSGRQLGVGCRLHLRVADEGHWRLRARLLRLARSSVIPSAVDEGPDLRRVDLAHRDRP